MAIAPVWFISHGAPDLVLRDQPATQFLATLRLGGIKGLVVISAHWFSRTDLQINVEPKPALMYDFYGFPEPLYRMRWPASSTSPSSNATRAMTSWVPRCTCTG